MDQWPLNCVHTSLPTNHRVQHIHTVQFAPCHPLTSFCWSSPLISVMSWQCHNWAAERKWSQPGQGRAEQDRGNFVWKSDSFCTPQPSPAQQAATAQVKRASRINWPRIHLWLRLPWNTKYGDFHHYHQLIMSFCHSIFHIYFFQEIIYFYFLHHLKSGLPYLILWISFKAWVQLAVERTETG